MDSINNILANKYFNEPNDVEKLKSYIEELYNLSVRVQVITKGYLIITPNSSLASAIRLSLPNIKKRLDIDKEIYIRTG